MKKINLLVMPLMAVSLLASCNNGSKDPITHTLKFEGVNCVMKDSEGKPVLKKQFEAGQTANLHLAGNNEGFEIPKEENVKLTITGSDDPFDGTFNYNQTDGSLSVKMTADITVSAISYPISYNAISKITVESEGEEYYDVTFEYLDGYDNQFVETENIGLGQELRKIYHIVEKTGDGGYVDYSVEAYPSEANGDYMFYTGEINTYDANGKVVSCIGIDPAEKIEYQYPDYEIQLSWIELKFADFELTKFYYTESVESSYNDNSALLKKVNKELYEDKGSKVLSLVTNSVKENIYNSEGLLVKDYMSIASVPIVRRVDYTYDANGLLTDNNGYTLTPKGEDGEFSTFIQTFDVNESSFEDYAQEPGFNDANPVRARAYMYKKTTVPNIFETECFVDSYLKDEYLLENYNGEDYGAYYKKTYGENGSYKDEIYAYTLTDPEPVGGQTREELHFLDLTPGELKETHEVIYDDYQNCIKDVYTTINEDVPEIVDESYGYTIDEDGKITNYVNYVEGYSVNTIVEYTTTDTDYGQTFGWVYNKVQSYTLV